MGNLERWVSVIPLRLRSLFRRDQGEQDLDDELQYHLEQETQRLIGRGLSPVQAQREARHGLYSLQSVKERCRDVRRVHWIEDAVSDARFALRTFSRNPGFAAIVVSMLALGIGVNTAVFTVTNAVIFKGFRLVNRNDRLLYLHSDHNGQWAGVSYPDFEDWCCFSG